MQPVVTCLHNVLWRKVGEAPEPAIQLKTKRQLQVSEWVNYTAESTRPTLGEVRWIRVEHPFQVEVGQLTWALFQSWEAFTNGMDEDIDSVSLVEIEILEQTSPQVVGHARQAYWAKVRCFEPIELTDVPRHFSESSPAQWFTDVLWPSDTPRVQIFDLSVFRYHHVLTQEARRFFITTGAAPERITLRGYVVFDEPIEICNCPFELSMWPHTLEK